MLNGQDGMTQGARANANGHIFEEQLNPLFRRNGYKIVNYRDYVKDDGLYDNLSKLVICDYPFKSIYGHRGKTEFLVINRYQSRVIRVECKWQQKSGSVDEKFPYMYLNCVYGYEEVEIILIVDGGGYKQGARDWLDRVVSKRWLVDAENPAKSIKLMTISEFTAWFNRELA